MKLGLCLHFKLKVSWGKGGFVFEFIFMVMSGNQVMKA